MDQRCELLLLLTRLLFAQPFWGRGDTRLAFMGGIQRRDADLAQSKFKLRRYSGQPLIFSGFAFLLLWRRFFILKQLSR
jgi:hypothetical protein